MKDLLALEKNRDYLQALKDNKKNLVPFLGAGFSKPTCPGWEDFLMNYFESLKRSNALLPEEITAFDAFTAPEKPNRLEGMADFLVKAFPGTGFKAEMRRQMEVAAPLNMFKKFHLLHEAFPFLKITTNYDRLIETTVPQGVHVDVAYGYEGDKLDRLFTHRHEQECLLKIHGGIADMNSIVLGTEHYGKLYGHKKRYNSKAALPSFLHRVFTTAQVLFIGCSLEHDRTTMILEDLANKDGMPVHYAIKKLPGTKEEKILVQRRLAKLGINVIWIASHEQIEEILAYLAEKPPVPEVSWTKMGSFVGREEQLAEIAANLESAEGAAGGVGGVQTITGRLYSIDGIGGVGKTALALEAARRFGNQFKDGVLPLFRVDEHSPVSFAMALAGCLGVPLAEPRDAEAARQAVALLLKNRRCLVLLDNVEKWEDLRYMIPPQMSASVLVTTRNRDICRKISNHCPGLWVKEIALDKFTREETLSLYRKMLDSEYREEEVDIYLEIGRDLGFLPIALRQAISLMAYTPHYRAGELRDMLKNDSRLELLRRGCAEVESDTRVIETVFDLSAPVLTGELKEALAVVAVCSPGPVPLDFLERLFRAKVFGAKVPGLTELLERLYTYSWCERREVEGQRYYELHQLVREVVRAQAQETGGEMPYLVEFIDVVHNIFTDKDVHFSVKERYIFQLEEAFAAAVQRKDPRLKDWLYNLYYFCTYRGYAHFYLRLTEAVERLFPGDQWVLGTAYGHRALILKDWGKLEEAMAFHKKEEVIWEQLMNRSGLAICYGNQALILSDWSCLEEAMTLHRKEEAIYEKLGDRTGLARTSNNQALILKAWGKLEEAMTLLQKQEAICEELGDRAGLSRTYGNQAPILSDWGRLEEAMTLHQKEEAICDEFGDRAGLAKCYGNQAHIHYLRGELEEAMTLVSKVEKICEELDNRAGLSRTYGNQGGILYDWGRLDEAMTMYKKQEAICEELGNRAGLARTWWNQGELLGKQGDSHSQAQLWRKSIDTNKSMGIPTEKYEKELKELMGKEGS